MSEQKTIAALWAFDSTARYPPQFVAAVSEGLTEAWEEETARLRREAEDWFSGFDDEPEVEDRWRFEVFYQQVPVPKEVIAP